MSQPNKLLRESVVNLKAKGLTYKQIAETLGFNVKYIERVIQPKIKNAGQCSVCKVWNDRLCRHHPNYSKPDDVELVCSSCHGKIHHPKGFLFGGAVAMTKKERIEHNRKRDKERRKKFYGDPIAALALKSKRVSRGIKACWVANQMGISCAFMNYLETGRFAFSPDLKRKFLKAINKPGPFNLKADRSRYFLANTNGKQSIK